MFCPPAKQTFHGLHNWMECGQLKDFLSLKRRCFKVYQFCSVYTTTDLCRGGQKDMLLPIHFYMHAYILICNSSKYIMTVIQT